MAFYIRRQLPGGQEGKPEYVHVGDGPALVTFGSDGTNDIRVDVTDPNERVNSRHCTLVYTGAGFRIDFERDTRVFIGDSPTPVFGLSDPFHDSGDKKVIRLRLGMPVAAATGEGARSSRNPVFHIYRDDAGIADLKKTKPGKQESYDPIERVKRNEKRLWQVAASAGGIAIAVVALGAFVLAFWSSVERRSHWMADMQDDLSASVGVVGVVRADGSFEPTGTGWLCCKRDAGMDKNPGTYIITNGHVWSASKDAAKAAGHDAKIVVRFPDKGESASAGERQVDLQTSDRRAAIAQHALYGEFWKYLNDRGLSEAAPNVYDVVAVQVRADEPALAGRNLFAIAPGRGGLRGGEPVAAIGYPVENLPYAVNYESPVPKVYTSTIVRRTSPFLGPAARSVPSLLALPAESAGGLSGSPVIAGENGDYKVIGLVMQASLASLRREEPVAEGTTEPSSTQKPLAAAEGASVAPAAAYPAGKRFATSNVVFATDGETVRELFAGRQRLEKSDSNDVWELSRENQFGAPLDASFKSFASMPACRSHPPDNPVAKASPALLSPMLQDARQGDALSAVLPLKNVGGYRNSVPFAKGEVVWIAVAYDKPSEAPLGLEIRETDNPTPENRADDFIVIPGFSSYVWTGAPQAGGLEVIVRGDWGAKVKVYIGRCPSPEQQTGVPANGQR